MPLDAHIEAILFLRAEPVEIQELATLCSATASDVKAALNILENRLNEGALAVVQTDTSAALTTRPELSDFIREVTKAEQTEALTKAQQETLAIIMYEHPVAAARIDYIRGVNSRYSLRSLLLRGLIEKRSDTHDARITLYVPTIELLQHLGVRESRDLPDYEEMQTKLQAVKDQQTHTS